MRSTLAWITAVAALVVTPWVALAGDDAADAVRRAVREFLRDDAAGQDAARAVLEQNPSAAVPELLRLVTELRAAASAGDAVVLAAAPSAAGAVATAGAAASDEVLQIYDVRDLTTGRLTSEVLAARIRSVGGAATVATETAPGGALVVKASPAAHSAVQAFLADLRRRAVPAFLFDARVVVAAADAALGADLSALRPGRVLRVADVAQRLALWDAAGDAEVVASPTILTLGDVRASVEIGREISFVADFDVEVSQSPTSGFIADPVVSTVFSGLAIDLQAWSRDAEIIVGLDATISDVDPEIDVVTSDLGGVFAEPVRFQRPSLVRTTIGRTVTVADGGSFVVRLPNDGDGARRLLLVSVHRHDLPQPTDDE